VQAQEALAAALQPQGKYEDARVLLRAAVVQRRAHAAAGPWQRLALVASLRKAAQLEIAALAAAGPAREGTCAAALDATRQACAAAEAAHAEAVAAHTHAPATPPQQPQQQEEGAEGSLVDRAFTWLIGRQQRQQQVDATALRLPPRPELVAMELATCLNIHAAALLACPAAIALETRGEAETALRRAADLLSSGSSELESSLREGAPAVRGSAPGSAAFESARRELLCGVWKELMVLLQPATQAPDMEAVRRRMSGLKC
jgi:hypothetical protein